MVKYFKKESQSTQLYRLCLDLIGTYGLGRKKKKYLKLKVVTMTGPKMDWFYIKQYSNIKTEMINIYKKW